MVEIGEQKPAHGNVNLETVVFTRQEFRLLHPEILKPLETNSSNIKQRKKSFIAPELVEPASAEPSMASDVFSLGLALLEAASLEPEISYYITKQEFDEQMKEAGRKPKQDSSEKTTHKNKMVLDQTLIRKKIRKISHVYSKQFILVLSQLLTIKPSDRLNLHQIIRQTHPIVTAYKSKNINNPDLTKKGGSRGTTPERPSLKQNPQYGPKTQGLNQDPRNHRVSSAHKTRPKIFESNEQMFTDFKKPPASARSGKKKLGPKMFVDTDDSLALSDKDKMGKSIYPLWTDQDEIARIRSQRKMKQHPHSGNRYYNDEPNYVQGEYPEDRKQRRSSNRAMNLRDISRSFQPGNLPRILIREPIDILAAHTSPVKTSTILKSQR